MVDLKLGWITGKRIVARWNIDLMELHQLIFDHQLPVFNREYKQEKEIYYRESDEQGFFLPDIECNILYEFNQAVEKSYPPESVGAHRVLTRMFFKLEDIVRFENKIPSLKNKPIDEKFVVFVSIIKGDLRPFLSKYSSQKTIEELIRKQNIVSFMKTENGFFPATERDLDKFDRYIPVGEKFTLSIDEDDPDSIAEVTKESDESLEPLIDIDIPPPPGKKAEYFLTLIEDEYEDIRNRAQKALDESDNPESATFVAEKRIQQLKILAVQAHRLSKQLPSKDIVKDPDSFVLYVLKTYIIRSIIVYEQLFQPFLKAPVLDEYGLRSELFGKPSFEDYIKQWEQHSHESFYKSLSHEIKALDAEYKNCSPQFIENITSNENWYDSVAKNAIQNNFIGYRHLVLILASDSVYLNESNYINLCKTYDIECMKDPPGPYEKILSNLTKVNICIRIWNKILSNWTYGNFPNLDNKYSNKSYIPLYNYDPNNKCLDGNPLRKKLLNSERKAKKYFKSKQRPYDLNKYQEFFAPHMKAPKFIKLEDLRSFFQNDIGLPLPLSLFPEKKESGSTIVENNKLRPSQQARLECRRIAEAKWKLNHQITIAGMIEEDDIIQSSKKRDGNLYAEKTVRNWIKDLCPNRSPGRPSKTKK